jgi:hypothetical protein
MRIVGKTISLWGNCIDNSLDFFEFEFNFLKVMSSLLITSISSLAIRCGCASQYEDGGFVNDTIIN